MSTIRGHRDALIRRIDTALRRCGTGFCVVQNGLGISHLSLNGGNHLGTSVTSSTSSVTTVISPREGVAGQQTYESGSKHQYQDETTSKHSKTSTLRGVGASPWFIARKRSGIKSAAECGFHCRNAANSKSSFPAWLIWVIRGAVAERGPKPGRARSMKHRSGRVVLLVTGDSAVPFRNVMLGVRAKTQTRRCWRYRNLSRRSSNLGLRREPDGKFRQHLSSRQRSRRYTPPPAVNAYPVPSRFARWKSPWTAAFEQPGRSISGAGGMLAGCRLKSDRRLQP